MAGSYYVEKVISKLQNLFKFQERELELKFKLIKALIYKSRELDYEELSKEVDKGVNSMYKRERDEWLKIYEREKMKENPNNDEDKDREILGGIIFKVDDRYKFVDKEFFKVLQEKLQSM